MMAFLAVVMGNHEQAESILRKHGSYGESATLPPLDSQAADFPDGYTNMIRIGWFKRSQIFQSDFWQKTVVAPPPDLDVSLIAGLYASAITWVFLPSGCEETLQESGISVPQVVGVLDKCRSEMESRLDPIKKAEGFVADTDPESTTMNMPYYMAMLGLGWNHLARACLWLGQGKPRESLPETLQGMAIARGVGDYCMYSWAVFLHGQTLLVVSKSDPQRLDDAIETLTCAYKLLARTGNRAGELICTLHIAHAHYLIGHREEAAVWFARKNGAMTSAMVAAQTNSGTMMRAMIALDIDLTGHDENGYSALDYALMGGSATCEAVIRSTQAGKQLEYETQVKNALRAANSALRELASGSATMRSAVNKDLVPRFPGIFAPMTVVSFVTFIKTGKMPRSSEGCSEDAAELLPSNARVVFLSHRWLRPQEQRPDDEQNSKWALIAAAVRALAVKHQIAETSLYLWIDFSSGDAFCF
jgi:hypothetical protein